MLNSTTSEVFSTNILSMLSSMVHERLEFQSKICQDTKRNANQEMIKNA